MMRAYGTPLTGSSALDFTAAEQDWTHRRLLSVETLAGVLYRVEAVSYSYTIDADREEYGTTAPRLELFGYPVLRWTEHGATLANTYSGARHKWVDLRPGAKQWASRTAREAVEQFRERKRRNIYVLERKLASLRHEMALADQLLQAKMPGMTPDQTSALRYPLIPQARAHLYAYGPWRIAPANWTRPHPGFDWYWWHGDYDGAPDANDNRAGSAASLSACIDAIHEWEDDQ